MVKEPAVDTREAILDAVDSLMARHGFRRITVEDIAREAGISKRTVYTYFDSKVEVGLSSIDRVVRRAVEAMAAIAATNAPPDERLRDMLVARVMTRVLEVQNYRSSMDELFESVRPAYMSRRRGWFETERDILSEIVSEISDAAPDETAELLIRATNAFIPYSLSPEELGHPDSVRAKASALAQLLVQGIQRT